MEFYELEPTLENYWRGIILFGKNSASYKFALAKSLIELSKSADDLITLADLADPFSRNLCEHLALSSKQGNREGSKFLSACASFM